MSAGARRWAELFGDGPVVVDGGMSTQLEALGEDISGLLWTGRALLGNPEAVARAHADFVAAGADVVISASYQVSRAGFVRAGLAGADADAALRASTQVARAAVASVPGARARVAASVGPYGAILHDGSEYRGRYGLSRADLVAFHRARLDVLVETEPDLLAIETIPDVDEAVAIVDVLDEYPGVPAWMTFSAIDGGHTCAGQPIEEAVAAAASSPSIMAVGINCTDPRHVAELVARARATTDLPVVVYPNAGGEWDAADGLWHGADVAESDLAFPASAVRAWQAAGAIAIGGCCGTDARAISRIAEQLAPSGS